MLRYLPRVFSLALLAATGCSGGDHRLGGGVSPMSGGSNQGGGGSDESSGGSGGGAASDGSVQGSGGTSGSDGFGGFAGSSSGGDAGEEKCQVTVLLPAPLPVDVVFAVDTSASMAEEVAALESRLNTLAELLTKAGQTPRIVILAGSSAGSEAGVCVPPPLGSGQCSPQGSDSRVPELFHHPQASIGRDALEIIYSEYSEYSQYLRHGSRKTFVVVSDADAAGTGYDSADAFIAAFDARDPVLLDNWRVASIHPFSLCPAAISVGSVYADLVSRRGHFSGDLCNADWDSMIWNLAHDISSDQRTGCVFELPSIPSFDPMMVNMRIEPAGEPEQIVYYVGSVSGCSAADGGWYYDQPSAPTRVETCAKTCERIEQLDPGGGVVIYLGCKTETSE
jgi:hypothetical protein